MFLGSVLIIKAEQNDKDLKPGILKFQELDSFSYSNFYLNSL